jgi:lysophospholipase L1-like esterase
LGGHLNVMIPARLVFRAIGLLFLLLAPSGVSAGTTVATVGDSFADGIYLALRSRPDLLKTYDVRVTRWSRPVIGLARSDYFDYPAWLRNSPEMRAADFCVVQIGSNDMQGIPAGGRNRWISYGSEQWKAAYKSRVQDLWRILDQGRCKEVLWILQPGFEKSSVMARNRGLINQLQAEALHSVGATVFDLRTTGAEYARDDVHFNRDFVLALGGAVVRTVVFSRQAQQANCAACHGGVAGRNALLHRDISPLDLLPSRPLVSLAVPPPGR